MVAGKSRVVNKWKKGRGRQSKQIKGVREESCQPRADELDISMFSLNSNEQNSTLTNTSSLCKEILTKRSSLLDS